MGPEEAAKADSFYMFHTQKQYIFEEWTGQINVSFEGSISEESKQNLSLGQYIKDICVYRLL